jgi:hypothetical protein
MRRSGKVAVGANGARECGSTPFIETLSDAIISHAIADAGTDKFSGGLSGIVCYEGLNGLPEAMGSQEFL